MKKASLSQYGVNSSLDTRVHAGLLLDKLQEIFPEQTLTNVKKDVSLKYHTTGHFMEMDAWIPRYNLGFEFQDSYHYVTTWYNHNPQLRILRKDSEKRVAALQSGVSLVIIPCWWDGTQESIAASINFQRPDACLTSEEDSAISLNPPIGYFQRGDIPDVGELMLASFPVEYKFKISNSSWWIGEKYDGVRFCWHPKNKRTYTRSGQILSIPSEFTRSLPSLVTDGEAWFGRGNFGFAYVVVRHPYESSNWQLLRMMAFDVPAQHLRDKPYEERYKSLSLSIRGDNPSTILVARMACVSAAHLDEMVKEVIEEEGEGIIAQRTASPYEHGRTAALIKLKSTQADKEAIVISHTKNGVELQLPNGTTFTVALTDVITPSPPITGDVVTFSYDGSWRGEVPVSPRIFRIRTDVSWPEVVFSFERESRKLSVPSQMEEPPSMEVVGIQQMRTIITNFAREKGFDPLRPKTWRAISKASLSEEKETLSILQKFKMKYYKMLRTLFPELDLDQNSWRDVERRRLFFEKYAKKHAFDPLIPENWYKEPRKKIVSFKGAAQVVMYHNNSMLQALMDLFPNIGLERSKLKPQYLWKDVKKRKKFFEMYARERGFDPHDPENWYLQTKEEIVSEKGGVGVLAYYSGSVSRALIDIFPSIGLDKTKFQKSSYWYNPNNRRQFFLKYAKEKGFDPYTPENWYTQQEAILNVKGANALLMHHKHSVSRALRDLFPDVPFDRAKLKESQPDPWESTESRREFFESYAKENGFDPHYHENWYSQSRSKIIARKGAKGVMAHHGNKVTQALYDLFPEVGFDTSRFRFRPLSWMDSRNRKMFFEVYAANNKFDPLVASNWHSQSFKNIMETKSARAVMAHHKNSVARALMENFPNIGLVKTKFTKKTWRRQI